MIFGLESKTSEKSIGVGCKMDCRTRLLCQLRLFKYFNIVALPAKCKSRRESTNTRAYNQDAEWLESLFSGLKCRCVHRCIVDVIVLR